MIRLLIALGFCAALSTPATAQTYRGGTTAPLVNQAACFSSTKQTQIDPCTGAVLTVRSPVDAATITIATTDYYIEAITATQAVAANLMATPVTGTTITVCDASNNAATHNITVTPAAGNIDSAATFVINTNNGCWQGHYTGTRWKTVASR